MDYSALISRLIKDLGSLKYADIETALVRGILEEQDVRRIKNNLVSGILARQSASVDSVARWLSENDVRPDLRLLEKFYELNIDVVERKINGSYYTPEHIVTHIVRETMKNGVGTVCDPACGSGAFLTEASKFIRSKTGLRFKEIYRDYIFGIDILPSNKRHVETILSLLAVLEGEDERDFAFNIFIADSLGFDWRKKISRFSGFDYVIGNPPYVRTKNLDSIVRNNIRKWDTGNFGNPDLYIPFFELAVSWTNNTGRVGYITPSTYLTSVNARRLRGFLSQKKLVEKIIDFNGWQIFKGATTYTCISILSHERNEKTLFALVDKKEKINALDQLDYSQILLSAFDEREWRLLSKKDAENIFKIEHAGSPLYKYVNKFVTGIATLHNDLFLVEDNGSDLLQKRYDGSVYLIERSFTKKIVKPNRVKDKVALKNNRERVIYPYEVIDGKARVVSEQYIAKNFPNAYRYLLAIKKDLALRDKGKRDYQEWFAYGRSQGVTDFGKKIILPMMGNRPSFIVDADTDSLIYCGYAIFAKKEEDFKLLEKVLNSDVMWYYIRKTSKNYSGGFKSFAKNYVKNFSIPNFSQSEKRTLARLSEQEEINTFLREKYQLA